MDRIDSFGRLILDPEDTTTISAWAVLQFGAIDPEYVFLHRDHAQAHAATHLDDQSDVVPVLVTGSRIVRA